MARLQVEVVAVPDRGSRCHDPEDCPRRHEGGYHVVAGPLAVGSWCVVRPRGLVGYFDLNRYLVPIEVFVAVMDFEAGGGSRKSERRNRKTP